MKLLQTKFAVIAAVCAVMVLLTGGPARAQEEPVTLLEYDFDIVSNYVFRGVDVFEGAFAANNEDPGSFQSTPAFQPSLTFMAPAGFSLNWWGSFALTERSESEADLATLDELDYTLSYAWENKLGSFDAGMIAFTLTNPRAGDNIRRFTSAGACRCWKRSASPSPTTPSPAAKASTAPFPLAARKA